MRDLSHSAILALSVVARLLALMIALKILSIRYGVEGFGLLTQVMAVSALFSTLAGGGLSLGLVREVAATRIAQEQSGWLRAGLVISLSSAIFLIFIAALLYWTAGDLILGDSKFLWIFLIIGLAQLPVAFGSTAVAFLSGSGRPQAYSISSTIGSIVAAAAILLLSSSFGFNGAMAACAMFALGPALVGCFLLIRIGKRGMSPFRLIPFDRAKIRKLLGYSFWMLITATAVPLALLFLRVSLGAAKGWQTVGEWQSVARIGDAYMQIFGVIFINLMLPRLSAQINSKDQFTILKKFVSLVCVLFFLGAPIFWFYSTTILRLIYNSNFESAAPYVFPQLTADFLKIIASLFVYYQLARGKPHIQAMGELVQALVMVLAYMGLASSQGGLATVWAYACGAAASLIYVALSTRLKLG